MNNEQLNGTQVPIQPNVQPIPNPNEGQPVQPQIPVAPTATPVNHTPVQANPVAPTVAPVNPTPVQASPVAPTVAPVNPAPVQASPATPTVAPVNPAPVQASPATPTVASVNPASVQASPVEPTVAPVNPAPVQASPVTPTVAPVNPTPVQASPVEIAPTPIETQPKTEDIQASVIETEENKEDLSDVANTTFDYNSLYGLDKNEEEKSREEQLDVVDKPMFTAQEIVIEAPTVGNRAAEDIVPEFNVNALDENANKYDKVADSAMNDDEKDKAETRRAIIWIVVLILILVVFVGFIFPIITGNK